MQSLTQKGWNFLPNSPIEMKNMNQDMAAAEENFRQREIRGQRCQRGRFSTNRFFCSKDLLPENGDLSRVSPGFCGVNFVRYMNLAIENFRQTCQWTMNNQSQKHANARPLAWSAELKPSAPTVAAHKHLDTIVRIYYLEMRFIMGFSGILAMQSWDIMEQGSRKFISDSSIDMNQKNQNTAATRRMALWKN